MSTLGRVLWIGAATIFVVRLLFAADFDGTDLFHILVVVGIGHLLIDHWDDRSSRRR